METFLKITGATIILFAMIVVVSAIVSLPLMLLWNWLMPIVIPEGQIVGHITWLQAWGLLVLCGFLFKNSSATTKS